MNGRIFSVFKQVKMSVARQMRERMFRKRESDDSESDSDSTNSEGSSRSSSVSSRGSRTARTPSPKIRVRSKSPPRGRGLSPLNKPSDLPKIPKWIPIPRSVLRDGTHVQPVPSKTVQPPNGYNLELAWDINSDSLCWRPVPEGVQVRYDDSLHAF